MSMAINSFKNIHLTQKKFLECRCLSLQLSEHTSAEKQTCKVPVMIFYEQETKPLRTKDVNHQVATPSKGSAVILSLSGWW